MRQLQNVISQRTRIWIAIFIVLAIAAWARMHWETVQCIEFTHRFPRLTSEPNSNVVGFSVEDLCRPGELEPWWAKAIIFGAFTGFVGSLAGLVNDVWIWLRRKDANSSLRSE